MKISYITLLLLFIISATLGQDKATPPPTRMTLPKDTTRAVKKPEQKVEAEQPQLELPDVLVLGKDKSLRLTGKKESLQPESPTLVKPGSPYEPISVWFRRQSSKPELNQGMRRMDKMSWLSLRGGGYTSIIADAGHWRKLAQGNYRLRGWLDRSNGQYNNSQYSRGGLSGKINYELAPHVTGMAFGNYALYSRGLHGAALNDYTRRAGTGSFGAGLMYDIARLSDGYLGFEIGGTSLQSDTSSHRMDKSSDFWYRLEFSYTANWAGIQWNFDGRYVRETFDLLNDTTNTKTSLGDIGVEALTSLSGKITAALGLIYQTAGSDSFATRNRVSPYLKINFMPANKVGLTAQLYTGYDYRTFTQRWQQNPYITHRIPLVPSETTFGLNLKAEVEIAASLRAFTSFSRNWMETAFYWQRDPQLNLIALQQINKPELTEMQIGFVAELSSRTRLQAAFINYSDKIESSDGLPNIGRIPYRPDFRIPIRATIQLLPDMFFTLQADIQGERPSNLNSTDKLPAYGLLHASLVKDFGEKFSAILTVRNLLDANYVIWENYPEMGVHVLFGFRAKF